jgi:hypothetical protein
MMRKREVILIVALLTACVFAFVGFRSYANADWEVSEARALVEGIVTAVYGCLT